MKSELISETISVILRAKSNPTDFRRKNSTSDFLISANQRRHQRKSAGERTPADIRRFLFSIFLKSAQISETISVNQREKNIPADIHRLKTQISTDFYSASF